MPQHSRDNPDPKNIIPDDQKRKRNASDRAQGIDSYFRTVEAAAQPRQAQAVTSEPRPQLKITIPATSIIPSGIPDGDAVENGVLLSASELQKCGFFFHSPSDTAPIPAAQTEDKNHDVKDKTYRPPKRSNALDDEAPKSIYASDGEEVTIETEHGRELREKREQKRKRGTSSQHPKKEYPAKKKMSVAQPSERCQLDDDDKMDIDSGEESDGKSALRHVEARDKPRAARRGPGWGTSAGSSGADSVLGKFNLSITNKIVSSPQRRKNFRQCAIARYFAESSSPGRGDRQRRRWTLAVVRDVRTRWNYTHAMIRRAVLLQEAIDDWVFKTPGLRPLLLTEDDWKTLREIANILEPFTEVTLQMSQSKIPTIPFVLPLYHKMEQHLVTASASWDKSLKIRHAAEEGLEKLRKYSIPAKLHHSYITGTILHPCLRSHWFAATANPDDSAAQEEAISKAEVVFRYIAETYLETSVPQAPIVLKTATAKPALRTPSFLASACSFQRPTTATSVAANSKRSPQEELADELDRYFKFEAAPVDEEVLLNPLLWWKIHATEFPTIARMARDYLAIPATSVSVERVFSKSRHICSNLRSSLKEKTIKMALLTKAWIRSGLFEMVPPKAPRRKHGDNSRKN